MLTAHSSHTAKIAVVSAAVVLLMMTGVGNGQNTGTQTLGPDPGWLILRGELISGPYAVEVAADGLKVNGTNIARPPEIGAPKRSTDEDRYHSRNEAYQNFWKAWQNWCEWDGMASAQQEALQFWRASPLVLQAYFPDSRRSELAILFRGDPIAERVELRPPNKNVLSADRNAVQSVQEEARSLQYALTHGALVIIQDEGYSYTSSVGEGAAMVRELQSLAASVGDHKQRAAAMRRIVPDNGMAEAMAEHLQPQE